MRRHTLGVTGQYYSRWHIPRVDSSGKTLCGVGWDPNAQVTKGGPDCIKCMRIARGTFRVRPVAHSGDEHDGRVCA